jgi:hypothetical protein
MSKNTLKKISRNHLRIYHLYLINTLEALVYLGIILTVLSKLWPRFDVFFVWVFGISLLLLAGFRTGGFDYQNYLNIINTVRSLEGDDFLIRSKAAKDPALLLIIEIVSKLTLDPQFIFLTVAALSVLPKILASSLFPKNRTFFLSLYAVFLAPGLEFAAMRTGLGLGLFMAGISSISRIQRKFLFGAAVASHASLAISVFGLFLGKSRYFTFVAFLGALISIITINALTSNIDRLSLFSGNNGTLFSIIFPALSLVAALCLIVISKKNAAIGDEGLLTLSKICLFNIVLSIVLSIPMVTVSFRIIEIAWVLLLMLLLSIRFTLLSQVQTVFLYVSWFIWLFCVSSSNMLRETWYIMMFEQI